METFAAISVVNKHQSHKAKAMAKYTTFKARTKAKYFISVLKHWPRPSTSPSTNITGSSATWLLEHAVTVSNNKPFLSKGASKIQSAGKPICDILYGSTVLCFTLIRDVTTACASYNTVSSGLCEQKRHINCVIWDEHWDKQWPQLMCPKANNNDCKAHQRCFIIDRWLNNYRLYIYN